MDDVVDVSDIRGKIRADSRVLWVMKNHDLDEERLAALIAELPPAPCGWVRAAQELPAARRAMDGIVARAEIDAAYRAAVLADLESALREAGQRPSPALLDALRSRLRPQ
jgi:hypothetical protein